MIIRLGQGSEAAKNQVIGMRGKRDEATGRVSPKGDQRCSRALPPLLKQIEFYFNTLPRSSDAYFFIYDLKAGIIVLSENWVADFEMPGRVINDMGAVWMPRLHPDDRAKLSKAWQEAMEQGLTDEIDIELRARDRSDRYVWLRRRSVLLRDAHGKPYFSAGIMVRLEQINRADTVTGLLNRTQFERAVKEALNEFRRTGVAGAILLLGLDNFKIVNETYNRSFGNRVLRSAADQITNILPEGVMLYKLDGDEFGVVLRGASAETAGEIFKAIQIYMSRQQFIDGKMYFCTVSGGTVIYPQGGREYLALHKRAEAALDLAKRDGKNRNVVFTREQYNRWMRVLAMRDTIKTSVENSCEGFSLFYQPQVSASSQRLIGAEALLRWKNPQGAMVSPMEFVPVLEETKMILPLGKWIIEEALKTCKKWREYVPDFHISINVSYAQIKDVTFFPFVFEMIDALGLPPDAVTLELTESMIVSDWTFLHQRFNEFREKGVRIAMDDFGTGYSSLAYLKKLPCDIVKLDREFVRHILENDFDRQLVEYTVTLCHRMGIEVCIEGVEETEVYNIVTKECRADYIQGYLFGRPASETDFVRQYMESEAADERA